MNNLKNLQLQLQTFILSETADIHEAIVATKKVAVSTRLQIYREAYSLRLIECLSTNFPALYAYLGTESFETLSQRYIETHPSTYRSIRWYGSDLPKFLTGYFGPSSAYLAELADFEWRLTLAFDAADDPILLASDISVVPPEAWSEMQFIVHSSVLRVDYSWNIPSLWQALTQDEPLPDMAPHPTAWLIWRSKDRLTQFYSLSEEEAWAFDALKQGLSFGEVCEGLAKWQTNTEALGMQAATYLKNWLQKGMFSQLLLSAV